MPLWRIGRSVRRSFRIPLYRLTDPDDRIGDGIEAGIGSFPRRAGTNRPAVSIMRPVARQEPAIEISGLAERDATQSVHTPIMTTNSRAAFTGRARNVIGRCVAGRFRLRALWSGRSGVERRSRALAVSISASVRGLRMNTGFAAPHGG